MAQSGWYHDKAAQCDRMALASTTAVMDLTTGSMTQSTDLRKSSMTRKRQAFLYYLLGRPAGK